LRSRKLLEGKPYVLERAGIPFHVFDQSADLKALDELANERGKEVSNQMGHFSSPSLACAETRSWHQVAQTSVATGWENLRLSQVKRSLLPLTALRAFEAAGRHESFKRAADELSVSEAAISRQVRDLERELGIRLFNRMHRAVHLTNRGRELLAELTRSFDAIDAALSALAGPSQDIVSVSAEPTFANLFLVPQLGSFSKLHPDLEVSLEANSTVVDLRDPDGPTLAVRYSLTRSTWPNVEVRHLVDDWLTPMVSPELAPSLTRPSELLKFKLLKDESRDAWTRWLVAAGIDDTPDWGRHSRMPPTPCRPLSSGRGPFLATACSATT
jgi:LysR family transcriptional regulator, glycine cleavage system transcriptional activator